MSQKNFDFYKMGDERLYAITISASSRHGRTKLHTFCRGDGDNAWTSTADPTRGQMAETRGFAARHPASPIDHPEPEVYDKATDLQLTRLMARRPDLGVPYGIPLGAPEAHSKVHLARGVDVTPDVLAMILDGLRSGGRHRVDIDDIKVVLSQLGSELSRLATLPDDVREHAEKALYCAILRRCTTI